MSEQDGPQLTDAQRSEWGKIVENWRGIWGEQFPDWGVLVLAVAARLAFLESERAHLHERADRATAELLALGRELRQARGRITEWQQACQDWADNGVSKADLLAFLFDDVRIAKGWPQE